MSRITIFYFSGTGNTKYVCNELVNQLRSSGQEAEASSIEKIENHLRDSLIDACDVLVLAYPIYGSDMPENMRSFIHNLPPGGGKPLAVLCTQLLFSGDGASILYRKLRGKGYEQRWAYQIAMPNNLCLPGSPFRQSADYVVHEKKFLQKARIKTKKIASEILQDKKHLEDHSFLHLLLAMFQRPAFRCGALNFLRNSLDINREKCIRCGKCARACPSQTISITGDVVVFNPDRNDCLSCLRCLDFCPVSAITFRGKVKEPLYKGPTKEIYREIFG